VSDLLLVAGAGLLGGAMNAIAGGGSFVTLPALVAAGVPSLNANATSTVALVPSALATAFAYRRDFRGFEGVKLSTMALISVAGGALGALLLLVTPQRIFDHLFPFLLLFGVLAFAFGRRIGDALRARMRIHPHALPAAQFALGVYGGYFGGAVGVMMMAAWSVLTTASINAMQASRHLLNASMNGRRALRRRRARFVAAHGDAARRLDRRRLCHRTSRPPARPGDRPSRHHDPQRGDRRAGVLAQVRVRRREARRLWFRQAAFLAPAPKRP